MSIVAHEDDSMLFQSPDLLHDIQTGKCVRTVFVTAGDAGQDSDYWSSRELGAQAAYAQMAGVANVWTQSDAGISGHPISLMTLTGNPKITLLFMRLPDGNLDGSGFAPDESQSLQKLYLSQISQINTVDGTSSYTLSSLTSTLTNLMKAFAPNRVDTQDYVGRTATAITATITRWRTSPAMPARRTPPRRTPSSATWTTGPPACRRT